tara:strand:+ start:3139 stop:4047 length:909 start_codon:yes stop_codon:yes gene_type:complete
MTKPSLLVVGGTGFIGYHVIQEAKKRGWKITSLSLNRPKKEKSILGVKYIKADINNLSDLNKKIKKQFNYVVNAGGYGIHAPFDESGKKIFETHFFGLLNIVKIVNTKKLKKFIQIGSSEEYGESRAPQKEDFFSTPNSPYAIAKLSCTEYLKILYDKEKFPFVVLRLFLTYGPKQGDDKILPQVIKGSLKNKKFKTSAGVQKRDFCFIDDVISAIFLALKTKKCKGEIFNIGSGNPIKIRSVIKYICKIIGKGKPQFGKLKLRKNENINLYPSIKKIKKKLKWKPKIQFSTGVKITINSFK